MKCRNEAIFCGTGWTWNKQNNYKGFESGDDDDVAWKNAEDPSATTSVVS
jgi:hypothetical protein